MTIKVLLADDQILVRAGLKVLVDSAPDLAVVGEAATGREAVTLARTARADVVLMDIRMPEMDGLAATREIMADEDLAGVRVLVLTTFEVDEYVFQALRAGASGFLGKGAEPGDLLDAIRVVARGESLLSPLATQSLIARFLEQPDRRPTPARGRRMRTRSRDYSPARRALPPIRTFTVGPGISPGQPAAGSGRVADYNRRFGITPTPECANVYYSSKSAMIGRRFDKTEARFSLCGMSRGPTGIVPGKPRCSRVSAPPAAPARSRRRAPPAAPGPGRRASAAPG